MKWELITPLCCLIIRGEVVEQDYWKVIEKLDSSSFRELMHTYGQDVWNFAFFLTRNKELADDISQDVFLQVYRKISSFRGESSMRTWLLAITRNIAVNYRRTAFMRRVILVDVVARKQSHPSAENEAMGESLSNDLWKIVMELPVKFREVLVLNAKYELSLKEQSNLDYLAPVRSLVMLGRRRSFMREHEPEWVDLMKDDPFVRKTFTIENMKRIEDRAADLSKHKPTLWRFVLPRIITVIIVSIALIVGIGLYNGESPVSREVLNTNENLQATFQVEKVEPYLLLVNKPIVFSLFPEEQTPSGFELSTGKVVQVNGRFGNWLRVNIITYDTPYPGDKWLLESDLAEWDPAKAKEGLLNPGVLVYDEEGKVKEEQITLLPLQIDGEVGGRYRIYAAGGYTGLINKVDFIPGPFLNFIDQSEGEQDDSAWLMSEDEVQAYAEFAKLKSDDLLKDLEPIVIFRYYVFASTTGDYKTQYSLYMKDEKYELPDLESFLTDIQADPTEPGNTKKFWEKWLNSQLEQKINGDSAYIVVSSGKGNPEELLSFGLTRNKEGIWKVNWLPIQ